MHSTDAPEKERCFALMRRFMVVSFGVIHLALVRLTRSTA
jgi:hypothetical protein